MWFSEKLRVLLGVKMNLQKMEFELNTEGFDSFEEEESLESDDEVEPQTPTLRRSNCVRRIVERYSPSSFRFAFVLYAINDESKSVKEAINFEEGKL